MDFFIQLVEPLGYPSVHGSADGEMNDVVFVELGHPLESGFIGDERYKYWSGFPILPTKFGIFVRSHKSVINMVTLESADNKTFTVDAQVARQSVLLRHLLDGKRERWGRGKDGKI